MGGAAYPDDWAGWLREGRNPNSRVHPEASAAKSGPKRRRVNRSGRGTWFRPHTPQLGVKACAGETMLGGTKKLT